MMSIEICVSFCDLKMRGCSREFNNEKDTFFHSDFLPSLADS